MDLSFYCWVGPLLFSCVNIRIEGWLEGEEGLAGLNDSAPPLLHSRGCCYPLITSDVLSLSFTPSVSYSSLSPSLSLFPPLLHCVVEQFGHRIGGPIYQSYFVMPDSALAHLCPRSPQARGLQCDAGVTPDVEFSTRERG